MMMVCGIGWLAFDYRIDHLPEAKSEQPKVDFGEVERFESSRKRNPNDSQSAFIDSSQMEATLSAMTHDQLMDGKTQTLISSWASAHPHDAKKWVLEMGNAQLRQPLAQVVALGIAKTEPRMAAMFVVN